MRTVVAVWSMVFAMPCLGAKFHDVPPGGGGGITMAVSPIAQLEEAIVVEATEFRVYAAHIDRAAGLVTIRGLPPGKYDLLLKFREVVAEGITFEVPGGYERLSRTDREGIKRRTWMSEDYFNRKYIARMGGNKRRVKLLVEQVRDKRTFQPDGTVLKGIMIRRFDLCEMRKTGKIWQVKKNRHLFREERRMGGPGTTLKFIYVPQLGGIRVGDEVVAAPPVDLKKLRDRLLSHFYRARWSERPRRRRK